MKPLSPLALFATCLLAGCHGVAHDEQIDGPYHLLALDVDEEMHVAYDFGDGTSIGRIPATVFAAGSDSQYVVAARHPDNDRSTTEYYYLVRALDGPLVDPSVTVRGPLDLSTFQSESERLGLPPMTLEIDSLK
jgi:hypothetical protein